MNVQIPNSIGIIAGKGAYPKLLAESARKHGVKHIFVIAFRRETDPIIKKYADQLEWIYLGQLGHMLQALARSNVKQVVMAGQITPTSLFTVRMDSQMMTLLSKLPRKNAETIFGAVGDKLSEMGIELLPASMFMESHMPVEGVLSRRLPTESEQSDIAFGLKVAKATSRMDIGQTVVIKGGTVLAVEAFEGTNETIKRAGRLGGPGVVVVKVSKPGQDMRFDIPVVGLHTLKLLKKVKAAVLAIEAGRSILLEREAIIKESDSMNLCLTAVSLDTDLQ